MVTSHNITQSLQHQIPSISSVTTIICIMITDPKVQKHVLEACMSLQCYYRAILASQRHVKMLTEKFVEEESSTKLY